MFMIIGAEATCYVYTVYRGSNLATSTIFIVQTLDKNTIIACVECRPCIVTLLCNHVLCPFVQSNTLTCKCTMSNMLIISHPAFHHTPLLKSILEYFRYHSYPAYPGSLIQIQTGPCFAGCARGWRSVGGQQHPSAAPTAKPLVPGLGANDRRFPETTVALMTA